MKTQYMVELVGDIGHGAPTLWDTAGDAIQFAKHLVPTFRELAQQGVLDLEEGKPVRWSYGSDRIVEVTAVSYCRPATERAEVLRQLRGVIELIEKGAV